MSCESRFSPAISLASRSLRRRQDGLPAAEAVILDLLDRHGASFAVDLARLSGLEPSNVRTALSGLMVRGLVTNDRFDPARSGSDLALKSLSEARSFRHASHSLRPRARRAIASRARGALVASEDL